MKRVNGKNRAKDGLDPPAQVLPMYNGYIQRSKRTNHRPSKGQNIQQIYIVRAVTALFIILALFVCCFLFESSLKTHGDVGSKSTEERHHFNDQVEKRSRVVAIDIAASAEEEHPPATVANKEEEQRSAVTTADKAGAAICTIQKGGLRYLDEWVDYNLALGFEKIYIYDNSDNFELQEWHKGRNDHKYIEVTHYPGWGKQMQAYEECGRSIRDKQAHKWIAFFDLDEFLVIEDIQKYPHIMDLLNTVPSSAGALGVNWKTVHFNNQMKYEPKPITLRFPRYSSNDGANQHIKTIVRAQVYERSPNPHHVQYTNPNITTIDSSGHIVTGPFNKGGPTDVVSLFHYHTKSLEEYKERCARGRADILPEDHRKSNPIYCKSDAEILSTFPNTTEVLDQSAWDLLKERVPKYSTFLSV